MSEPAGGGVEASTNVKVAVRVRPLIEREAADGAKICVIADEELACVGLGHDRKFTFDHAFSSSSSQDDVYNACVAPLVDSCFEGYNGTVFAYGQTGSGKTHTMGMGSAAPPAGSPQEGIAPRVVRHVFNRIDAMCKVQPSARVVVTASFLEIHNEELRDLLAAPGAPPKPLAIREGNDGSLYVSGAREVEARTARELTKLLQDAAAARATSSTLMNEASSRSHVVASIALTQHTSMQTPASAAAATGDVQVVTKAKLHLVDLAGSERVKRSGVADNQPDFVYRGAIGSTPNGALTARFKEAVNINQGLLALGSVISALGDERKKGSHVPYRDSRLTRLLQDSLGGNSRTAMIACVSCADNSLEESLNTLKWAHRARNISNKPEANRSATGANKQEALLSMQAEVGMMALSLARRTAELVPMYAGHGATILLNQVLSAVDPGSVSSIAACARTLDCLGALQLRLLHNQEDWHGGEQPQTKLYSINQAVMAGSSSQGLRSHPVGNQSMFEDDTASLAGEGPEDAESPQVEGRSLQHDSDTEGGGDSVGRSQVAHLKAALKTARQELCTTVNALKETRDDLERDEMIFADQQRELLALRAELLEARGGKALRKGAADVEAMADVAPHMLQHRACSQEPAGEDGICWTTNAAQLASAPITGRVPVGALGARGRLGSCRGFSLGQLEDAEGGPLPGGAGGEHTTASEGSPERPLPLAGGCPEPFAASPRHLDWGELSGGEEADAEHRRRRSQSAKRAELESQKSEAEVPVLRAEASVQFSVDGSTAAEAALAAELAAAAAEKAALEADKAQLEAAVQKQQEDFEMVRSALESRMATLCASISEQENIIQELQAEEQRAKEANNALNERLAALEAEISEREGEITTLRMQLAGMEGSMREIHEARISKTQAHVSMLRRQVVEVEGSRGAERERQRNASRAASMQAELKSMKAEQEALRRRLADRTAVNERSARQHAQEAAALKRAADAARTRISQLEAENRQQRLQLKRKTEEIMVAENRLKAKTNEQQVRLSQMHSLRRSSTMGPSPGGASPRVRLMPSASARYPVTSQPTTHASATTPRGPLTSSASARQPSTYLTRQSSVRAPMSPRSSLGASQPTPRMPPQGPFARPPQTPRSQMHSASARAQPVQASPRSLTQSLSMSTSRAGRDSQSIRYPAHPTVNHHAHHHTSAAAAPMDSRSPVRRDSTSLPLPPKPSASPTLTPRQVSHAGAQASSPSSPTASSAAAPAQEHATAVAPFVEQGPFFGSGASQLNDAPELEDWLQQQVHTLADRACREARAQRMRMRCAALEVRKRALREQHAQAAQVHALVTMCAAQQHPEAKEPPGAEELEAPPAGLQQQEQALEALDDALDAAEEELSFLESELATAEKAAQRGDGSAALELRRRIASLPALSLRGALQGALQVLVEYRVRLQQQAWEKQEEEAERQRQRQLQQQQQQNEEAQQHGQEPQEQSPLEGDNAGKAGAVGQQQQQQQQRQDVDSVDKAGQGQGLLQQQAEQVASQLSVEELQPQQLQQEQEQEQDGKGVVAAEEMGEESAKQPAAEEQQQQQPAGAAKAQDGPHGSNSSSSSSSSSSGGCGSSGRSSSSSGGGGNGRSSECRAHTVLHSSQSSRGFDELRDEELVRGPGSSPAVRASSAALAAAMSGYRSLSLRTYLGSSTRVKPHAPPPPLGGRPASVSEAGAGAVLSRTTSVSEAGVGAVLSRTPSLGIGSKGAPAFVCAPAYVSRPQDEEEEEGRGVPGARIRASLLAHAVGGHASRKQPGGSDEDRSTSGSSLGHSSSPPAGHSSPEVSAKDGRCASKAVKVSE